MIPSILHRISWRLVHLRSRQEGEFNRIRENLLSLGDDTVSDDFHSSQLT